MVLNEEQKFVLRTVASGRNAFVTGSAGVGKSFIIREICKQLDSQSKIYRLLAPTGVAALNIGGQTIHRFAKLQPEIQTLADYVKVSYRNKTRWRALHVLIIDEISMVHPDLFTLLNEIAKLHRGSTKPFGGLQIILVGDLFQLPYVPNRQERKRKYIYETPIWQDLDLIFHVLKQVMRQNDLDFITALNDIRVGNLSEAASNMLLYCSKNKKDKDKHYVKLFALNTQKNFENEQKLAELNTESKTYDAQDVGDEKYLNGCRAEKKLTLKLNCPVMLLWNMPELGLSNGSVGIVTAFENGLPKVSFNAGVELIITTQTWKVMEKNSFGFSLLAARTQIPLAIAYSISVHKSQSLTLDYVEVDLSGTFACGQMYVALSRAKTMQGLVIRNYHPKNILVDKKIKEYYWLLEAMY